MGKTLREDVPVFGNSVLVRSPKGEEKSFVEKAKCGIFLAWDHTVTRGAWVACMQQDRPVIIRCTAPVTWPSKDRWKFVKGPKGAEKVWVSTSGEVRFGELSDSEVITFEERVIHPDSKEQY